MGLIRSHFWLHQSLGENPAGSANSWEQSSAGLPLSEDYTDFLSTIEQQEEWYELGLQALSCTNTVEQQKGIEYLTGAARKCHISAQYELGKVLQKMDLIDRSVFWYIKAKESVKKAAEATEAINGRPAKRLRN